MEEEQIGLDFDIEISPEASQEDTWRSDSESISEREESDRSKTEDANKTEAGEDGETSTVRKLKRILDAKEDQSSEDSPIWPRRRKKRRRSISRSIH